uniref:Ig-like domain-containing protein n=1 Tax=Oreochromis niloticus TaxID=8128 RepID=A0A669E9E0_ORENI
TPEGRQHSVFLPSEVVVDEGEDATLPCRSITAGQRVKSAQWRRDGEVVLGLNPPQVTYGNGFESRVSVPSDWYQRGDLSLSIKRVQLRDRGVYFCDVDKTERHRSAVRLRVRETSVLVRDLETKPTLMVSTLTLRVCFIYFYT